MCAPRGLLSAHAIRWAIGQLRAEGRRSKVWPGSSEPPGKGDPLHGIRHVLHAGRERLTPRQQTRLANAFAAHPDHVVVEVAYHFTRKALPESGLEGAKLAIATNEFLRDHVDPDVVNFADLFSEAQIIADPEQQTAMLLEAARAREGTDRRLGGVRLT